ncbi:hypothetical protein FOG51_03020 [Hanseniaspora uvarum]|nr:hypothetical protein FOG51_03020 [Hanseniaspora uvarum]
MAITVTANVKRVSFKPLEPVPVAEVVAAKNPEQSANGLPKIERDYDYKVNDLIMDATPLISQPYSHYKKFSKNYYTTPTVYNEIKSSNARKELEEYWNPLGNLQVRHPKAESIKFVKNFAILTGDFNVLSENDMHILALAYEIHVEKLGSENLREHPGQKLAEQIITEKAEELKKKKKNNRRGGKKQKEKKALREKELLEEALKSNVIEGEQSEVTEVEEEVKEKDTEIPSEDSTAESNEGAYDEEEDEDEWITPENLAKQMLKDQGKDVDCEDTEKTDDINNLVALATGDFAVQNVALQINLSLMNFTNGLRITKVRNYRLRCHACFHMIAEPKDYLSNTKVMKKLHFCPSCGGAGTLIRCAVSVDCKTGEITPHLKKNFQWFKRGLKYSIASPQSNNSKKRYGKKGYDQVKAYHNTPILQEDQPEYAKMMKQHNWVNRHNEKVLNQYYDVSGSGSSVDNTASVNNVINPFEIDGLKSHKLTITDGNRYINTNGANGNNKNNNGLKRKTRGRRRK